jgi:hypothetical protein
MIKLGHKFEVPFIKPISILFEAGLAWWLVLTNKDYVIKVKCDFGVQASQDFAVSFSSSWIPAAMCGSWAILLERPWRRTKLLSLTAQLSDAWVRLSRTSQSPADLPTKLCQQIAKWIQLPPYGTEIAIPAEPCPNSWPKGL